MSYEEKGLIDVKDKALVFVQKDAGNGFEVYQDGKKIEGIREININADIDLGYPTTHEIEYLTGHTKG
ncbi:hypothetical protein [Oceanobacillus oncorhynchi]|uniref:hypothetical protein n=1 Tax=Oceanobacillus oncorhynchi TaxID=545501 RepID=UPI00186695B9|nr:hypothetical protein [Oceanobacillus oncorhynchi]